MEVKRISRGVLRSTASKCLGFLLLFVWTYPLIFHVSAVIGSDNDNVLFRSFSGNHYSHITLQHHQPHTHITHLYWLTTHKRSVLYSPLHYGSQEPKCHSITRQTRAASNPISSLPSSNHNPGAAPRGKWIPTSRDCGPGKGFRGLKAFVILSLFKPVFSCRGEKSTSVACQGRCVCLSMHVKGLTVDARTHTHTCQISLWSEGGLWLMSVL